MAISYGLRNEKLAKFNETARVPFYDYQGNDGYKGSLHVGGLEIHGLQEDCTTLHINNANTLMYAHPTHWKEYAKALEEIKRYMHYSGKNTAILTFALCKGHDAYTQEPLKRIEELGLKLCATQWGSRHSAYTKYTCILEVEPHFIGYDHGKAMDFTNDPWYKARQNQEKK